VADLHQQPGWQTRKQPIGSRVLGQRELRAAGVPPAGAITDRAAERLGKQLVAITDAQDGPRTRGCFTQIVGAGFAPWLAVSDHGPTAGHHHAGVVEVGRQGLPCKCPQHLKICVAARKGALKPDVVVAALACDFFERVTHLKEQQLLHERRGK
jgi:hypothetical protein